jgi:hypothetical protein
MAPSPLTPWRTRSTKPGGDTGEDLEALAGRLMSQVDPTVQLSEERWARIHERHALRVAALGKRPGWLGFTARGRALVLIGAAAIGIGGGLFSRGASLHFQAPEPIPAPVVPASFSAASPNPIPVAPSLPAHPPSPPRRQLRLSSPLAKPPRPMVPAAPSRTSAPAPAIAARLAKPRLEARPDSEAAELRLALSQLRMERDPAAALATLVIYHLKFPQGQLVAESVPIEVDANLALHRRPQALAVLNQAAARPGFEELPRAAELRLLRAELLAREELCPEALPLFDQTLGQTLGQPLGQTPGQTLGRNGALSGRALYGRAACRAAVGDARGSRADLESYLRQFPTGDFAAQVRNALRL